jgi:hypothetical protein
MHRPRNSNAFESGKKDATRGQPHNNPYTEFSPLWGLYNHGYNSVIMSRDVTKVAQKGS